MRLLTLGLTLSLCSWIVSAQSVPIGDRAAAVAHYDLELHPQLEARTVEGTVSLTVQVPDAGASRVVLNRGALEIDAVLEGDRPLAFRIDRTQLQFDLPPANGMRERTIALKYHGRPASGLVFVPEREQLHLREFFARAVRAEKQ